MAKQSASLPHGFTLVEVLVTTAILVVFIAVGVGAFRRSAQTEILPLEAKKLLTQLRQLQAGAQSGSKPVSGCDTLTGYEINFFTSYYEIRPSCTGLSVTPLPNLITLAPPVTLKTNPTAIPQLLQFKVLSQGTNKALRICLLDSTSTQQKKYELRVTAVGEIQDLGFVVSNPWNDCSTLP